jgi:PAS domain S-box-containing protein
MFGYEEAEVIGKPMTIIIPERYRSAHSMGVERFIATGVPRMIGSMKELHALRKDGSEVPIELSLSTWKTGEERFFSGIIRDITERKQAEEAKMRLLERLIGVQEEERRRIARELHDETGQSLTCLLMGLKMIEQSRSLKTARNEASRLRQITSRTLEDVGRLAAGLHPTVLEDLGLPVALRRYASEIADSSGIVIRCEADGLEGQRLPLGTETGLFRIAQEALTNSAKHSNAKQIEIIMKKNHERVYLAIQDDGNGFDVKTALKTAAGSNRLGLHGMMERAVILGGSLQIDSGVDRGTTISIEVELRSS